MLALITIREAATKIAQAFGTILNLLNLQACIVGVSRAGEHPSRSDTKRSMAQRPLRHRFVGSTESGEKGVRIRSFRRVCRKPIHLLFDQEEVSRLLAKNVDWLAWWWRPLFEASPASTYAPGAVRVDAAVTNFRRVALCASEELAVKNKAPPDVRPDRNHDEIAAFPPGTEQQLAQGGAYGVDRNRRHAKLRAIYP